GVLQPINYTNLDELPQFSGENTTTEFLTRHIWEELAKIARDGGLGRKPDELSAIRVSLHESHVARAWFEAEL
ncbi:MAG: 6-carboxytetrahydropterin synthase, partial [Pseudomonadota bacterium]